MPPEIEVTFKDVPDRMRQNHALLSDVSRAPYIKLDEGKDCCREVWFARCGTACIETPHLPPLSFSKRFLDTVCAAQIEAQWLWDFESEEQ
ncbi:MAG: hypothetical protein ACWA40_10435 [Planktomarina sp.]